MARAILDRLAEAVADACITLPGAVQQQLTISTGLVMYPLHTISAHALLQAADQAFSVQRQLWDDNPTLLLYTAASTRGMC